MKLQDLTADQLKRAAAIKKRIEVLNRELGALLRAAAKSRGAAGNRRSMDAATKKKIAASQKKRWAKIPRAAQ